MADQMHYLPWTWTIISEDPTIAKCPSPKAILGTYAGINAAVSGLSLVFGHRWVVNKLTCGLMGHYGSRSWKWAWIIPLALQIGAAFAVATLIKRTTHYKADVPLYELSFLLLARPRLSYIFLANASFLSFMEYTEQAKSTQRELSDEEKARRTAWTSSANCTAIAEVLLQSFSFYVFGRIVHFASRHGYYPGGKNYHHVPGWARLMYAGALAYLILTSISFSFVLPGFIADYGNARKDKPDSEGMESWPSDYDEREVFFAYFCYAFLFILSWWTIWLFWTGFVHTAGDQ
ncbi:hypothetical protein GP486_002600 [Trichoglossum hirsutum]|uniref:Uncharacterized protein n=1 Tax=Trichoglossum hirsutum TaxID=265104 RepID=A0A9P8LDZ6_9PEZI|nr:hypothetical protein GP486_002600 [Trichoglossum hirsutum]